MANLRKVEIKWETLRVNTKALQEGEERALRSKIIEHNEKVKRNQTKETNEVNKSIDFDLLTPLNQTEIVTQIANTNGYRKDMMQQ